MSLTYNDTISSICEFLEVAIHTILCLREVYPAQVFTKRRKYDAAVYQSRSPLLNDYISGAVRAIAGELGLGHVRKVVLVIKNQDDLAIERYVFSVENMIEVDTQHRDIPIPDAMDKDTLNGCFRAFLVRLAAAEGQLHPISKVDGLTFVLILEMQDDKQPEAVPNELDPVPWLPAVKHHTTEGIPDDAGTYVVRAVETGIINISFVIQEVNQVDASS